MLAQYVQPLFMSPYGYLRAKAAWTAGLFADIRSFLLWARDAVTSPAEIKALHSSRMPEEEPMQKSSIFSLLARHFKCICFYHYKVLQLSTRHAIGVQYHPYSSD